MENEHHLGISVLIVTYNAEAFIEGCIKSTLWSDEVVVIDLGSQDQTLEICRQLPVRIETHPWVPAASLIRDEIMAFASFDWVLEVDPDEIITEGLAQHLQSQVGFYEANSVGCVMMPRQNIVFNRWLKHGDWWPDWQGRFGRKNRIKYPSAIHHAGSAVNSKTVYLEAKPERAIIHYSVPSLDVVYERVLRYAKRHAKEYYESGNRFSVLKLILDPSIAFIQCYFFKGGFRDGRAGFVYTFFWKFLYTILIYLNIWELEGFTSN